MDDREDAIGEALEGGDLTLYGSQKLILQELREVKADVKRIDAKLTNYAVRIGGTALLAYIILEVTVAPSLHGLNVIEVLKLIF